MVAEARTQIRDATPADADAIRGIQRSAFPGEEGEIIARLAVDLLANGTSPPTISLVAEADGAVAGHVAFSPVALSGLVDRVGYLLAPLAVRPDHQMRGIGSSLVAGGIERVSLGDAIVLLVYGDPGFYGRFGFNAETAARFIPPYPLRHPIGWQGLALRAGEPDASSIRITCVAPLCDPALW